MVACAVAGAAVLLAALAVTGLAFPGFPAFRNPQSTVDTVAAGAPAAAYPLHTSDRWILDSSGERVKLASVNWDGAESPEYVVTGLDHAKLADIAHWIKANGFNSVRLPWSNELYERNPVVQDGYLAANPDLKGKHALDVMDSVIDALGRAGLMVVLDNHVSQADWCCGANDGNELWYSGQYPESKWISDWQGIAGRYKNRPYVVGAELRNEVRQAKGAPKPSWDAWASAAERAGNAVLSVNQNLLIVVGGVDYQTDLEGARTRPVRLKTADRLVYAPHAYKGDDDQSHGYEGFKQQVGQRWGYLLTAHQPYTAPLWVSEFGTCITFLQGKCDQRDVDFFNDIQRYLREGDIDWAYWQLGSTQSDSLDHGGGKPRNHGAFDHFGLMNRDWNGPADARNVGKVKALQAMTQHP